MTKLITYNPWRNLRAFTDARIGLGRAGISLPTHELLKFQLAHAQAQDAVHTALNPEQIAAQVTSCLPTEAPKPLVLHSAVANRQEYLCRPDLGRRLDEACVAVLKNRREQDTAAAAYDLGIIIVDGLSARAVSENIQPMLTQLLPELAASRPAFSLAPVCIVEQGRVAIGDEIGELLHCRCVLLLIGERPGLSSPDSLGAYLTWAPKVGNTDAGRNCVSNIRPAGLSYASAVQKIMYLLRESRSRQLSGVDLKDRSETGPTHLSAKTVGDNFLLHTKT